jgi:hypothetical protein
MKHVERHILENSDCISEQALKRYAFDHSTGDEKRQIELHLAGCEICSDMVEGMRLFKRQEAFEHDLEELQQKLNGGGKVRGLHPYRRYLSIAAVMLLILGSALFISRQMSQNSHRERELADAGIQDKREREAQAESTIEKNPAVAVEKLPATTAEKKDKQKEDTQVFSDKVEEKEVTISAKEEATGFRQAESDIPSSTSELAEADDMVMSKAPAARQEPAVEDLSREKKQHTDLMSTETGATAEAETVLLTKSVKSVTRKAEKKSKNAAVSTVSKADKERDDVAALYRLYLNGKERQALKMAERMNEDQDTVAYVKARLMRQNRSRSAALYRSVHPGSVFYRESRYELAQLMKEAGERGWEDILRELTAITDSTGQKATRLLKRR